MTILVVEDETSLAELFQGAFERRGHACLLASTIEEAHWTVMMAPPDAITLDLTLPGSDSLAWLESLARSHPELARRTTIVTGRLLSDVEADRAARCGAIVLMKPLGTKALVDAVIAHAAGAAPETRADRGGDEAANRRHRDRSDPLPPDLDE